MSGTDTPQSEGPDGPESERPDGPESERPDGPESERPDGPGSLRAARFVRPWAASALGGAGLAPLLVFATDAAALATGGGATGRTWMLAAVAAGTALAARRERSDIGLSRPRGTAWLGAAIVLAGVAALFATAWGAAAAVVVAAPALAAMGVSVARPGAALLGAAAALASLAPAVVALGWPPVLVLAFSVLVLGGWLGPGDDGSGRRAPRPAVLLAVGGAGAAIVAAVEIARPFVMQHLAGTRGSQHDVALGLVLGAGLGGLVPWSRRWARPMAPAVFVAAAALCWQVLRARAGVPAGAAGSDVELVAVRALLGPLAVAAGLWLGAVWVPDAERRSPLVAALALGGLLGSGLASVLLPAGTPVARVWAALVRHDAPDRVESVRVTRDGVLRTARLVPPGAGRTVRLVHGRRVDRAPAPARLEQEEFELPLRLAAHATPRLLVVGAPSDAHREAALALDDVTWIETAGDAATPADPLLPSLRAARRPFDVVVVLSTPSLGAPRHHALAAPVLAGLAARLTHDGVLAVWMDPTALPLDAMGAVARRLAGGSRPARAWLALDGYAGPLVAVTVGAGGAEAAPASQDRPPRGVPATPPSHEVPLAWLQAGRPPAATVWSPRPAWTARRARHDDPLAPAGVLTALADAATRSGEPALAGLLASLALHAEQLFDVEVPLAPLERHRFTAAEGEALVEALAAAPDDPLVRAQLHHLLDRAADKQRFELVLDVADAALAVVEDATVLYEAGRVHAALLDPEAALEHLERAVAADPGHVPALVRLGAVYRDTGRAAAAESALQAALAAAPDDPGAWREMGLLLAEIGRLGEASPWLAGALAAQPGDAEVEAWMARIEGDR